MTVNYDITTPDEIDEISPYIHRHWYASRRIVVYDIFDISHDIINEWANLTVETIRAWDPQYPYLAVHNVSRRGVATKYSALPLSIINPAITHDARASLFTTSEEDARFRARIAGLVSIQLSGYYVQVLTSMLLRHQPSRKLEVKIFTEKPAALSWLASVLDIPPDNI
ncbi:MAG: hypothetical protein HC876_01545 [Chloroflexaceae bacterium]|nr:hypothetical protein [Chloroflexaceae bacterium]NJO04310.1 hypothetical protein [Chloroflexaceae bacterium]